MSDPDPMAGGHFLCRAPGRRRATLRGRESHPDPDPRDQKDRKDRKDQRRVGASPPAPAPAPALSPSSPRTSPQFLPRAPVAHTGRPRGSPRGRRGAHTPSPTMAEEAGGGKRAKRGAERQLTKDDDPDAPAGGGPDEAEPTVRPGASPAPGRGGAARSRSRSRPGPPPAGLPGFPGRQVAAPGAPAGPGPPPPAPPPAGPGPEARGPRERRPREPPRRARDGHGHGPPATQRSRWTRGGRVDRGTRERGS